MRWDFPGEQSDQTVLKDKYRTNSGVESSKVVGHSRKAEIWPIDILARPSINRFVAIAGPL